MAAWVGGVVGGVGPGHVMPSAGRPSAHLTGVSGRSEASPTVGRYPRAMEKGDQAPDFELLDEEGKPRKLSELAASGPVVLFFYPAAMTYGCTHESCHFRDMKAEFEAVGAQRVGISADQVEKQKQFSDKHSFDYPLLSDPDGVVATQFGVRRKFTKLSPTKRATFVIGPDLRVIEVIQSEVRMNVHADRALEALKADATA